MSSGDRRHHDTERRFSVTLLRRHAAHLSAPVIRNRNNDAICGVRPTAGTSKSSSGGVVPVGSNLHRGKLHHQGRCATDRGRTWPPADCPRHKSARGWSTQTPMTVALSSLRLTGDWTRRPHTTELYCFHRHITPSFPEPVDGRLQAQALGPGCATANTAPCWFTGMSQGLLLLFGPPYWVL
jgi:hypothetical protein